MKDQSLFEIGAWVVYPSHGVGKLDAFDKFEINGQTIEFFVVSFPKNKLTLKLPVKKALDSGLRNISSKDNMEETFSILAQKINKKRTMWSKRVLEYEGKINSGDPQALAEVVRDLYRSETETAQSFSERQIYQHAIERLAREVSVVEEINEEDAIKKLEMILQAA